MEKLTSWKQHFLPSIWQRGEKQYRQQRVRDLELSASGEWHARVTDARGTHDVVIVFYDGDVAMMACTCEYSQSNKKPCPHMAAMLMGVHEMLSSEQSRALEQSKSVIHDVLAGVDENELREFVASRAENDPHFLLQLYMRFHEEFEPHCLPFS